MQAEKRHMLNFSVRGQNPLEAVSPLFSNFVAISRVGTDVQFEFLFLDINQVAQIIEATKAGQSPPSDLVGRTVAKIVVPGMAVLQAKEHLATMFGALEDIYEKFQEHHERTGSG